MRGCESLGLIVRTLDGRVHPANRKMRASIHSAGQLAPQGSLHAARLRENDCWRTDEMMPTVMMIARRRLGRTGLDVSVISLGTVELGLDYGIAAAGEKPTEEAAAELLRFALAREHQPDRYRSGLRFVRAHHRQCDRRTAGRVLRDFKDPSGSAGCGSANRRDEPGQSADQRDRHHDGPLPRQ